MAKLSVVGKGVTRVDSLEKVTGAAKFTADFWEPGRVYAKVFRSPFAHARIISMDTSKAEELPGVKAVVKPEDAPDKRVGVMMLDRYVLPRDGVVRFVGEPVAIVVADSIEIAEEALDLVDVEYEELSSVFDAEEAMGIDPPTIIHPEFPNYVCPPVPRYPHVVDPNMPNVFQIARIRNGDVERGFRESDLVIENRFSFARVQHCPLEPHIADAWVGAGDTLTVRSSRQGIFNCQSDLCDLYGLPPSKVRVLSPYVGGAFGGKIDTLPESLAALAALKTGRTCRLEYTREEVFVAGNQRVGMVVYIKDGVKRDGTLVAREMKLILNNGAYAAPLGRIMAKSAMYAMGATYRMPNFKGDSYSVYTNNPVTTTMRGVESPQAVWATEQHMDIIAQKLGLDPLEVRKKNLLKDGDTNVWGEVFHDIKPKECLEKAAEWIKWSEKPQGEGPWRRGKGIAIAGWVTIGGYPCSAIVKVHSDGTIEVRHGSDELGQGLTTVLAQIAAEEFGLSVDHIRVVRGDTFFVPYGGASLASRSTFHEGQAVLLACRDAKQQLFRLAAAQLGVNPEHLETSDGKVYVKASPEKAIPVQAAFRPSPIGYVTGQGDILGVAEYSYYVPPVDPETGHVEFISKAWSYLAYAVEIGVNVETGEVKVLRVSGAYDVGQPINEKMCEGQLGGGIGMGTGTAIYEELVLESGIVVNPNFADYKIPGMTELPSGENVKCISVGAPHPDGPYGAKGLGEMTLLPFAAAVGNAFYNAVGVRIKDAPLTRERVMRALKETKRV